MDLDFPHAFLGLCTENQNTEKVKQSIRETKKKRGRNFVFILGEWKFHKGSCSLNPAGPRLASACTMTGEEKLCQKVCFLPEPHLHIWIIHSAYKHNKWDVATRHLKAEIRLSQLIIKMSNVSGWTHTPRSPPLVWWLYAQTIDNVSSYGLLRCSALKSGFPSPLLLCSVCQRQKTRPCTPNGFSNSPCTPPHIFLSDFETKINKEAQLMLTG